MAATKIEWADATWNPITGCTPISEGCDHCYAQRRANNRLRGRYGYPADEPFRVTFHKDRLDAPQRWKKPRRIFVCSMGDIFHESVQPMWVDMIMNRIRICQQHTFMILTKRPDRAVEMLNCNSMFVVNPNDHGNWKFDAPKNLWLGVTAENQARADERIPILLQIPAAVRFVSVEPMLGPVDIRTHDDWLTQTCCRYGRGQKDDGSDCCDGPGCNGTKIDWVICGGETGPGARPMHPDWVRSLRDQCQAAGVAFYFKGWGDWLPVGPDDAHPGVKYEHKKQWLDGENAAFHIGKKAANRLLDGRTWYEFPKGQP